MTDMNLSMRNKIAAHFMRVEVPETIVHEIWENRGVLFIPGNEDMAVNLNKILNDLAKAYIKFNHNLEIDPVHDFNIFHNGNSIVGDGDEIPNKIVNPLYQMRMYFDNEGTTTFKWGESNAHPLYPYTEEAVESERGMMLIYPTYVEIVDTKDVNSYLEINGRFE